MNAPTGRHPGWRLFLPIVAVLSLLTSCVSGGGDDGSGEDESGGSNGSQENGNGDPLATSLTTDTDWGADLQFEINALERVGEDRVRLDLTAVNNGEETARILHVLRAPAGVDATPDGVNLIDTQNGNRHLPLMKTDEEECLCATWQGDTSIPAGGEKDIWVAFPAPPEDVTAMTVSTPVTPDLLDIPLSEGDGDSDISDASVEDPEILPLRGIQDDIDGDSSRDDAGEETSIMLASDVLFDTDESDLTSDADETLEQVAQEIDDSSDKTVEIDGHTDNTGTDSINGPLSEDRAESVKERLEELVTRDGVDYETAGHGSRYPVGNNDTDKGREKNRRVTITFEK